jgi:hypothetical protein
VRVGLRGLIKLLGGVVVAGTTSCILGTGNLSLRSMPL